MPPLVRQDAVEVCYSEPGNLLLRRPVYLNPLCWGVPWKLDPSCPLVLGGARLGHDHVDLPSLYAFGDSVRDFLSLRRWTLIHGHPRAPQSRWSPLYLPKTPSAVPGLCFRDLPSILPRLFFH